MMKHLPVTMGPRHKGWLYGLTAFLWLSGTLWLLLPEAHPAQSFYMRIHGAAAMGFLMAFGALLVEHVPRGWQEGRQRPLGGLVVFACGLLVFTGWLLYYSAGEHLRHWTHWVHVAFGLCLPGIIFVHVWRARAQGGK